MSKQDFIDANLTNGEVYAGILFGDKGDYHVVGIPIAKIDIDWNSALIEAAMAGGDLPSMRELSLLYINAPRLFAPRWYWASETHATEKNNAYALNGAHGGISRSATASHLQTGVLAVRRIPIA